MPMEGAKTDNQQRTFGAFGGVFTPCTLTILGVIMFLRFGQVVGQAGFYLRGRHRLGIKAHHDAHQSFAIRNRNKHARTRRRRVLHHQP